MTDDTQTQLPLPEVAANSNPTISAITPLISTIPGIVDSIGTEENNVIPTDIQNAANKAAIDASGSIHLSALYKDKVNNSHAKVANAVATIMSAAKRTENWLHIEVVELWDKIENEIFGNKSQIASTATTSPEKSETSVQ
jgi:hypothetical protein